MAQARRQLRNIIGGLLVSLGTAMFAGAVSLLVDALAKDTSLRWWYLAGFSLLGLLLSGGGAWLLGTLRSGVALSVLATDSAGDQGRYQDEADAFAHYGAGRFVFQTMVQVPVDRPEDFPELRTRTDSAIHTLGRAEPRARSIGLLFVGRQEVAFHLGGGLRAGSRRVDLYYSAPGAADSHFLAVRLTPTPPGQPRPLDLSIATTADPVPVTLTDLPTKLTPGTPMALAVNLSGPTGQASFTQQVLASARRESVTATVIATLPAAGIEPTTSAFESTVAAILATAAAMPAAPGLLYLRGPVVISVAVGRYLHATGWTPMRHNRTTSDYDRYVPGP
ncbi:hypothetical protein GCM10027589_00220 [Actinocorallia lasiicapitis]